MKSLFFFNKKTLIGFILILGESGLWPKLVVSQPISIEERRAPPKIARPSPEGIARAKRAENPLEAVIVLQGLVFRGNPLTVPFADSFLADSFLADSFLNEEISTLKLENHAQPKSTTVNQISLSWDGRDQQTALWLQLAYNPGADFTRDIPIIVRLPGKTVAQSDCRGYLYSVFRKHSPDQQEKDKNPIFPLRWRLGNWKIDCDARINAKGNYMITSDGSSFSASGLDDKGKRLSFQWIAPLKQSKTE